MVHNPPLSQESAVVLPRIPIGRSHSWGRRISRLIEKSVLGQLMIQRRVLLPLSNAGFLYSYLPRIKIER